MIGIDSMARLDELLGELYQRHNPPHKLYGILMCRKTATESANLLIGDYRYYDLKSGDRFHIIIPGWDFLPEDLSDPKAQPTFATYFSDAAFADIEHEIAARLEHRFGYDGGYQLIIVGKDSLGTNWNGATMINIDKLVDKGIYRSKQSAFSSIINIAVSHRHATPVSFYKAVLSSNYIVDAINVGKDITVDLIATTIAKVIKEP